MLRLLKSLVVSARFSVRELLDLAATHAPLGDDHLRTIFGWYHERAASTVRGLVRTAAAVPIALLVATLDDKGQVEPWHVGVATGVAVFLLLLAAWTNWHLGHIQRELVISTRLYHQLTLHDHQLSAHVIAPEEG